MRKKSLASSLYGRCGRLLELSALYTCQSIPVDMRVFKKEMGMLINDPLGVAERLDEFLGTST